MRFGRQARPRLGSVQTRLTHHCQVPQAAFGLAQMALEENQEFRFSNSPALVKN